MTDKQVGKTTAIRSREAALVKSKGHAVRLRKMAKACKNECIVVSPYFSDVPISSLIKWLRPGVQLRFIFRWPSGLDAPFAFQPKALERLMRRPNTTVYFVPEGLHAKIYMFDGTAAIVTSANFTQRGLGMKGKTGSGYNHELGTLHTKSKSVAAARDWIHHLPTSRLTDKERKRLCQWHARALDVAKGIPSLPLPKGTKKASRLSGSRRSAIEQSLERGRFAGAYDKGTLLKGQDCLLKGLHHGGKKTRHARAITSDAKAGTLDSYHFEVTRRDVLRFAAGDLDSLLFVPTTAPGGSSKRKRVAHNAPIVLFPLEKMLNKKRGDKGIKKRTLLRDKGKTELTLVHRGSRGWFLRVPGKPRRRYRLRLSHDGQFAWLDDRSVKNSKVC